MGSINCKEYRTRNDELNQATNENETSGTYHSTSEQKMEQQYTEAVAVCTVNDIQENEMKALNLDEDTKILLVKQKGQLKAVGNKCTHYGAPLHTGALGDNRVRCPWHGACFNLDTGDIEDFPGLDSLPCYDVSVDPAGNVMVRAKLNEVGITKRVKHMTKREDVNKSTYVIVGGGPAGAVCAETLRQEGFAGRIVMLCREKYLPYDRVKLSKAMDIEIEKIALRDPSFYEEHAIEVKTGVSAKAVNTAEKIITCSNNEIIEYEKLFIATGCTPFKPPITGSDLRNVLTVREYKDVSRIVSKLTPELNVVCLGASFIALESAAFLVSKVASVTVVGRDKVPLAPVLGNEVGQRIMDLFVEKGVNMRMESGIEEIIGDKHDCVTHVLLKDGTKLPCDMLIMGTGSRYNTDFLQDSGININENGSIDTDQQLQTNVPGVYVGGDIANAPVYSIGNERAAIGHYQLAQYHGRIAAMNMYGNVKKLHTVPFFFTMLFGKGIRYSGYGKFNSVFIDGSLEEFKFVAYYLNENDNVVAVASCGRDPIVSQFAEFQSQGKCLGRGNLEGKTDPSEWTKLLNETLHAC